MVTSGKNPLWKSKHLENKKKERKKKVSTEKEFCLLPRAIFIHTRTYSHTGKKKRKKKETKGGRRKKGVLFDGQEG